MKLLFMLVACILSFTCTLGQSQKEIETNVEQLINPLVNTNNYSGSLCIVKNGKYLINKSYGKMSQEFNLLNTPDTKFFLASASMIFTSAAIMKLAENGALSLKDPLAKFIPEYKHGSEITIHDLLSQRSGIPAIGTTGNVDYDSITKFTHTTKQLIEYFSGYDLLFKPGTKYNHGRSDYILLAFIIEKLTGLTFGAYLEKEIFIPLGMTNTGHYDGESTIISNLAKGYTPYELYGLQSAYQIDWSSKTGHASIYSTTGDLVKFGNAIFQGKLLSKNSWEAIFSNHGDHAGYGWFVTEHLGLKRYQMNGRAPGYSSYFGIYPEEELIVVMLSNNYVSLPGEMGKPLAAIAMRQPYEKLNLSNAKMDSNTARPLEGKYKFGDKFYRPNYELEVYFKDGDLYTTWGGLIPVITNNKSEKRFILRTYWSSIEFKYNEAKKSYEMIYDEHKGVKL